MQFLVTAYDGSDKLQERLRVRPQHLANLPKDHIIAAGGLLTEKGEMKGSALIMEYDSREELDSYLAGEPYVVEKVWQEIKIEPMNVVIGKK